MRTRPDLFAAALLSALAPACTQPDRGADGPAAPRREGEVDIVARSTPPDPMAAASGGQPAFAAIPAGETIRLTGTEPFWGGTIAGDQLRYTTPENQAGEAIVVRRFAGNNGLGFSGVRNGQALDIAVTPGTCSDGMSDRRYPFTATLRIGEEQRSGCAWTDRQPFEGAG